MTDLLILVDKVKQYLVIIHQRKNRAKKRGDTVVTYNQSSQKNVLKQAT